MATKVETKFQALGMAPPGDGKQLDRVYSETVQNLIRQHKDALARAADPDISGDQKEAADETADRVGKLISKVSKTDLATAVEAITLAEEAPQHTLTIGEEAP